MTDLRYNVIRAVWPQAAAAKEATEMAEQAKATLALEIEYGVRLVKDPEARKMMGLPE